MHKTFLGMMHGELLTNVEGVVVVWLLLMLFSNFINNDVRRIEKVLFKLN